MIGEKEDRKKVKSNLLRAFVLKQGEKKTLLRKIREYLKGDLIYIYIFKDVKLFAIFLHTDWVDLIERYNL